MDSFRQRFGIKNLPFDPCCLFLCLKILVKLPPRNFALNLNVSAIFGDRISPENYLLVGFPGNPSQEFGRGMVLNLAFEAAFPAIEPEVPWFGGSFFSMAFNTLCSNVPGPVHAGSSFPRGKSSYLRWSWEKSWKKISQNVLRGRSCLVYKPE